MTFFIRPEWMAEAAQNAGGSWTVMQQFGIQAAAVLVTVVYAAVVTLVLLVLIQKLFGFRLDKESEMTGLDQGEHAEQGYGLLNLN